jgi:homoserine kinase type II
MDHDELKEILKAWGLGFRQRRDDLSIAGSPERCLFRVGIETDDGGRFVLERIAPEQLSRRTGMGAVLQALRERGLGMIQAYLSDTQGAYVTRYGTDLWQISPYTEGVPLSRSGYIFDGWRGSVLADFLVALKKAAAPGLPPGDCKPFSIMAFINDLEERMRRHDPAVLEETEEIIRFLHRDFEDVHNRLSVIFCHGDLHPLNVIWSADDIACVIDWEFMGEKPEFYDIANLIGCIGMENPEGLTGPLVHQFLFGLKKAGFPSTPCRQFLVEAVIALRFAWLSEWLRKGDREMVELEIVYLKLLLSHIGILREEWDLPAR